MYRKPSARYLPFVLTDVVKLLLVGLDVPSMSEKKKKKKKKPLSRVRI